MPGILINVLGRSTIHHRALASATVWTSCGRSVGRPRWTRPAVDAVGGLPDGAHDVGGGAHVGGGERPDSFAATHAAGGEVLQLLLVGAGIAGDRLVEDRGFVVTPVTELSSISDCRPPLVMRSRSRSSNQIDTPAAASSCNRSDMGPPHHRAQCPRREASDPRGGLPAVPGTRPRRPVSGQAAGRPAAGEEAPSARRPRGE